MLIIYGVVPVGEATIRDELASFRERRRHAHACPACYGDEPCGMGCDIERDLDHLRPAPAAGEQLQERG